MFRLLVFLCFACFCLAALGKREVESIAIQFMILLESKRVDENIDSYSFP